MDRATIDLWVGAIIAVGLASLLVLILRIGLLADSGADETYRLRAEFDNIGGLKVRAPVKSAGVVVGRVSDVQFSSESYRAVVTMTIGARYKFSRDTLLTVSTSGLLGEQYVSVEVGGDPEMLKDNAMVGKTQSAMVMEKVISQFMFNKAAENDVGTGIKK
jgi:phospholipid/cholesterol/gamma-HCH transport system substrate-binding protein